MTRAEAGGAGAGGRVGGRELGADGARFAAFPSCSSFLLLFLLLPAAQALAALRGALADFFLAGPDFLPRRCTTQVTSSHTYDAGML